MQERVIIQDQGLEVDQAPHLGGQALQLVVAQIQVQQVRQVDEQLVGDVVDAARGENKHSIQKKKSSSTAPFSNCRAGSGCCKRFARGWKAQQAENTGEDLASVRELPFIAAFQVVPLWLIDFLRPLSHESALH